MKMAIFFLLVLFLPIFFQPKHFSEDNLNELCGWKRAMLISDLNKYEKTSSINSFSKSREALYKISDWPCSNQTEYYRLLGTINNPIEIVEVLASIGFIDGFFVEDIDGDKQKEIVFKREDVVNYSYVPFVVFDDLQSEIRVSENKIEGAAHSRLDLLDLDADNVQEIMLFAYFGKGGIKLRAYKYESYSNLQEIFSDNDILYARYDILGENNEDSRKIKVTGSNFYSDLRPFTAERIYNYDIQENKFILESEEYYNEI